MNWRAVHQDRGPRRTLSEPDGEDASRSLTLCEAILVALDVMRECGEEGGKVGAAMRVLEAKAEVLQAQSEARARLAERKEKECRCVCRALKPAGAHFCHACDSAIPFSLWLTFLTGKMRVSGLAFRRMTAIARKRQDTMAPVGSKRLGMGEPEFLKRRDAEAQSTQRKKRRVA